jgi:hypothetical protein
MADFYRFKERELTQIYARELEPGDERAWGGNNLRYGLIPLGEEAITVTRGEVLAQSEMIAWRCDPQERILVRRK